MEISIWIKIGIFVVVLVAAYIFLRYQSIDPFAALFESFSEMEFNMTALVLTLAFSVLMWFIIWKNPFWVSSTAYSVFDKIFLTVAVPVVGYPLAVRALNKD